MIVKDAFWLAVYDCLTDLFVIPGSVASTLCLDRRVLVDIAPHHLRSNIYYHREPFDIALDLAQSSPHGGKTSPSLSEPSTLAAYEVILARHGLY